MLRFDRPELSLGITSMPSADAFASELFQFLSRRAAGRLAHRISFFPHQPEPDAMLGYGVYIHVHDVLALIISWTLARSLLLYNIPTNVVYIQTCTRCRYMY